ncbi:TetR/AcrR family transcriptional regulator [Streptomyces avicenniae]|uniref:TetR/AcrR family transcriptional regulator n=1 Tax=Streptomyces avicenniae TaxID=500153 RepID=UPI00069CBB23|nr:TetR/AcrR family transcriptional regulator [Streptomyces avicenniae]
MPAHQRADARRNYLHVLAVAEQELATRGADASFEQIARTAGVGSATVRRHFPSRRALLEAVSRKRVEALHARALDLAGAAGSDPRRALLDWLDEVVAYCVRARELAVALSYDGSAQDDSCSATLQEAAEPLLRAAVRHGAVARDVTAADLIALAVGVTMATEHRADPAAQAQRLFRLATEGLSPARPDPAGRAGA